MRLEEQKETVTNKTAKEGKTHKNLMGRPQKDNC